jgi:hypothetical protein
VNARIEQTILEKLRQLPPERLAEVEDFVDFLRAREASCAHPGAQRSRKPH